MWSPSLVLSQDSKTVHFLSLVGSPLTTLTARTLMVFGTTSKAAASKCSAKNRITASGPPTVYIYGLFLTGIRGGAAHIL